MSRRRRPTFSRRRRQVRRFRVLVLVAIAVVGLATWLILGVALSGSSSKTEPDSTRSIVLLEGERQIGRVNVPADGSSASAREIRRQVAELTPTRATRRSGRARIVYRYDRASSAQRVLNAAIAGKPAALVARRPVAASIATEVVAQAQRNTCESAALSILLSSLGVIIAQERLQRMLPVSGTADPIGDGTARVWGDPDRGFVGRPDGGGVAGGFGVYPGPIASVARRLDVPLVDMTGASPKHIYERLLSGRAVMAWIGLSDGPFGEWRSPSGKAIRVNFGEHTVVLRGIRLDGRIDVVNPLKGTEETWTASEFELLWNRLGRRALST